jgi:hypothetical protein
MSSTVRGLTGRNGHSVVSNSNSVGSSAVVTQHVSFDTLCTKTAIHTLTKINLSHVVSMRPQTVWGEGPNTTPSPSPTSSNSAAKHNF